MLTFQKEIIQIFSLLKGKKPVLCYLQATDSFEHLNMMTEFPFEVYVSSI